MPIRPNFVALNAAAIEIAHLIVGERGGAGPDLDHQAHNRISVSVGHPLCGADGIVLNEAIDDLRSALEEAQKILCHLDRARPQPRVLDWHGRP